MVYPVGTRLAMWQYDAAEAVGDSVRDHRVSVVIATRNRPAELARTVGRLSALDPAPPIIVVDNASDVDLRWLDDHPGRPDVVRLPENRGAAARTIGAQRAGTRYVAFSDDDSWWAPRALSTAADTLDRYPEIGLLAARTLVGPQCRPDPLNRAMAASPLRHRPRRGAAHRALPGTPVLGCLACAAVVRRSSFLGVDGFPQEFLFGGEETLLCYDLAAAGWEVRYVPEVVAHHHPSPARPERWRRQAADLRNTALIEWMRRPLPVAAAHVWQLARAAGTDRASRMALTGLVRRLPSALAHRRALPPDVEQDVRLLESTAVR